MKAVVLDQKEQNVSPAYLSVLHKIEDLGKLCDDWDGEDSLAPTPEVIANAQLLAKWILFAVKDSDECLEKVAIHALPHGTIRFTWYNAQGKNILCFEAGKTKISYFAGKTDREDSLFGYFPLEVLRWEVKNHKKWQMI